MRTGQHLSGKATILADESDPAMRSGQPLSGKATILADESDPAMRTGQPLSGKAAILADDSVMRTGQPLSGKATIPADDPAWLNPPHIPGQPKPIPPRNELLLYIPYVHNYSHTSLNEYGRINLEDHSADTTCIQ